MLSDQERYILGYFEPILKNNDRDWCSHKVFCTWNMKVIIVFTAKVFILFLFYTEWVATERQRSGDICWTKQETTMSTVITVCTDPPTCCTFFCLASGELPKIQNRNIQQHIIKNALLQVKTRRQEFFTCIWKQNLWKYKLKTKGPDIKLYLDHVS